MKRFIALLLALTVLLAFAACGETQVKADEWMGMLNVSIERDAIDKHIMEKHPDLLQASERSVRLNKFYENIAAALLALDKGDITTFVINKVTGDYLLAHNDKYAADPNVEEKEAYKFSMLTLETNAELHGILDSGIRQLKEDGTLDALIARELNTYIESDPKPAELPHFDGAKTYRIAVTGDVPPMDFVTADGKAAGFNVALLTEIANISKVNFTLVQVDSGARAMALSSGKVDAIFWTISYACRSCGELFDTAPEDTLITESYFTDFVSLIQRK